MVRVKGNNGRYIPTSEEKREENLSVRLKRRNKERLDHIANERGLSRADLIEQWIENGCDKYESELNFSNLENIKLQVLDDFKIKQRIGEQSSKYKQAQYLLNLFIKELTMQDME